jgi:hypothetical protein
VRIFAIVAGAVAVVLLCVASFGAGVFAGGIVGPSPQAFVTSITTPNTEPASSGAVLATPRYSYGLSASCRMVPVGDTGFYFDPENRSRLCSVPPRFPIEPGQEPTPSGGAQLPPNCAVTPDDTVYCSPGWELDFYFLRGLYRRGELPSD